jgi:hypothetical protein
MRTDREKAQERHDLFKKIELVVVVASTLMLVLFMARSFSTQTNGDNTTELARAMFRNTSSVWQSRDYSEPEQRFQETMVALCLNKTPLDRLSPALQTVMRQFTCDIGVKTATCNSRYSIIAKAIRDQGLMPEYNEVNWFIVDTTFDDKRACVDLFNNHSSTVRQLPDWEEFYESEKQDNIENNKAEWSDMITPMAIWAFSNMVCAGASLSCKRNVATMCKAA